MASDLSHATGGNDNMAPYDAAHVYRGPYGGDAQKNSPGAQCGPCDPAFPDLRFRFLPMVVGRILLNWIKSDLLDDADAVIGSKLTLAPAATGACADGLCFFSVGACEDASSQGYPTGWKLSCADTTAGKKGAIVPIDYGFVATCLLFRPLQPAVYAIVDGTQTITRASWTDSFVKDLQAGSLENLCVAIDFGDDGEKEGGLGNPGLWPQQSGLVHPDAPTNGTPFANQFMCMFMGAFTGGVEGLNQMNICVLIADTLVIEDPTDASTIQNSISVGLECEVIGYYVCPEDLGICMEAELGKFARYYELYQARIRAGGEITLNGKTRKRRPPVRATGKDRAYQTR